MLLRIGMMMLTLMAATLVAAPLRAQTFQLPSVLDSGAVIAPPGSEPTMVPPGDYIDVDQYIDPATPYGANSSGGGEEWGFQLLPSSLIYRSYLASTKESRMYGGVDVVNDDSTLWNATVGSRLGLFRYGTHGYILPDGWQLDVEGSAQVRLDVPEDVDVRSVDFRGGIPLTYGMGAHRFKFGYYHLSSHLGDEFLLKNPTYPRLNFARDVLIFGYSYYATPNLRFYGEAGWAFYTIVSEPWEFQVGVDYAPQQRTGIWGAPFFAVNGHFRQELDYSGKFTAQAGWAWRGDDNPRLLRIGVQYFNGKNNQYSFAFDNIESIGAGVWYDF